MIMRREPEEYEVAADRTNRRRRLPRRVLEASLWTLGLSCLAWTGWAIADAHVYQRLASRQLEAAAEAPVEPPIEAVFTGVDVPAGTPLATLRIPRLDLSVVVAEGTGKDVLRRAVGRLAGSAHIGEPDNVVIAGHRDSFFSGLGELQVGDRIALERDGVTETYAVEWMRVVQPDRIEVAGSTGYPALTLVTCYPFWYVGSAPERYVVRAVRITV